MFKVSVPRILLNLHDTMLRAKDEDWELYVPVEGTMVLVHGRDAWVSPRIPPLFPI